MKASLVVLALTVSSFVFAQQSNPPQQRVQRTPPPNTPSAQTPSEQPPQTQEPRTARQPEATPATQTPAQRTPEPSEGMEGQQIRPMHFDMTEVPPVVTHHSIRVGGRELRYTATAGRMPIKDAEGARRRCFHPSA